MFGRCCHWMGYLCVKHEPLYWNEEEIDPVEAAMMQEEEVSMKESEDTSSQWNKMKDLGASMLFSRKAANLMIALVATTLAISASYVPTAADSSAPQLQ